MSLFLNPSFSSMQWFCRQGAVSGSPRRLCPLGATPKSSKICNWFEGKSDVKYGAYFFFFVKIKSMFLTLFLAYSFADKIFV